MFLGVDPQTTLADAQASAHSSAMDRAANGADDALIAFSAAHSACYLVFSGNHLLGLLWPFLNTSGKAALRGVCKAIRGQVDGLMKVVASPSGGFSAGELTAAMNRWSAVTELTLFGVNTTQSVQPLATATLARLEILTVRQALLDVQPWGMSAFGDSLATLQMVNVSCCASLTAIDAMASCVQLRVMRMHGCESLLDLSPLAACRQLEELWMAGNEGVGSVAPLQACTRLIKLDVRGCSSVLRDQVEVLREAWPQLADPSSVELEGLVHELQPRIPAHRQAAAMNWLIRRYRLGVVDDWTAVAAAGVIPPLVQLLRDVSAHVRHAAACALSFVASGQAENQAAIAAAGAIPHLVQLLCSGPEAVKVQATGALTNLAINNADNQGLIADAGAIPGLVLLLGPDSSADVQETEAGALANLTIGHAGQQAAMAIPHLVLLLGPDSSADVQEAAAGALANLANLAGHQDVIAAAGAIPRLVLLLQPGTPADAQVAAMRALITMAADLAENQAAIINAGAIPLVVELLGPVSPDNVQATAAEALCMLAHDVAPPGAIPPLVLLLKPDSSADVQQAALRAL
ncbi:hypothetical protein FOA52_001274 [Chlamydomonas sp. UWO 241]|nr:hypothetical protein FOA52_001274 [Chlamydomonas sp. UWO 241]